MGYHDVDMNLRNLVTGSDVCAPSTGRRGNVVSNVAETLLQRTRANERDKQEGGSSSGVQNFFEESLVSEEGQNLTPAVPAHAQRQGDASFVQQFQEFQRIFDTTVSSQVPGHVDVQERDRVLSDALKRFMDGARDDVPFAGVQLPSDWMFDPIEQQKIGARVQHLCHVMFSDHGPNFAEQQAALFLNTVGIRHAPSHLNAFHQAWHQAQGRPSQDQRLAKDWTDAFAKLSLQRPEADWVSAFSNLQHVPETSQASVQDSNETKDISSALIQQMANDPDPKFRNSKFLQFVQKINSGALVIEGDQVKEGRMADQWAAEFTAAQQQNWNNIFDGVNQTPHPWLADFKQQEAVVEDYGILEGGWLEQSEIQEWVDNYQQMAYGPIEEDKEYAFAIHNPFLDNPDALNIATDLFSRGNLGQAVLAAEAQVHKDENNLEAWILLGKIHAENDNDQQAIAALDRARALDPANLNVLLDLGVCHANELHELQTVDVLFSWLKQHPLHQSHPDVNTQPHDPSQGLSHAMHVFHRILSEHPGDTDVLIALGVLHHLGRNFEEAISLFQSAVHLRPDDYSLWNKLGATQANAAQSGEAIASYQRALQQKSNYMRGWANLGISYANVGDYAASVQHYVHALSLNKEDETVWGYLKSSAICAGRLRCLNAVCRGVLCRLYGFVTCY